ncbi:hypothetical protein [Thaumasiovibrio subtropicus]|uniref:hypothetical protein n=1 Tax=Thaumasiovibrio subtropicus TaxID=1891207 RepID=UPI000B3541BF|nr:hypothetical protein [Thaumasiovibrio subtropicus]
MKEIILLSSLLVCFCVNANSFPTLEEQIESKEVRMEVFKKCLRIAKSDWPKACHENIEAREIERQKQKDALPSWLKG